MIEVTTAVIERILTRVTVEDGCWLYQGARDELGYGRVSFRRNGSRRSTTAHRAVYEALVGLIPAGLELDHLCRVPSCCNPDHLEPVTHRVNMRRGSLCRATETHCANGHPWTDETTYLHAARGRRGCRLCQQVASARHYVRKKGQVIE